MSSSEIRTGRKLGDRYTLLTLIARGGMGEVWKARDSITGTLVAAKVLRPELTGEEVSLSRLRLEATNAMRAKHPNIAAVLDSGESNSQGWLIMEMVEGEPLSEYIGDGLTLTPAQLIPLLIQTAYALDAAARADVVHRDIKPANIIVKSDGRVKLTDFGVSLAEGQANLTAAGMVMGTAQYLSPEQAMGKVATPLGDLYALGVIAFEALTGNRPFTGASQVDIAFAHVNEAIPPLPETVPEPLAALVTSLLAKDPAGRPPTGAALARELTNVADALEISTAPWPLTNKKTESAKRATPRAGQAAQPRSQPSSQPSGSAAGLPDAKVPATPTQFDRGQWHPVSGDGRRSPSVATPSPSSKAPSGIAARNLKLPEPAAPEPSSKWGLWVIIGLTVLTIVLIIFAMLRNHGIVAADPLTLVLEFQQTQEVQPWLIPQHVA